MSGGAFDYYEHHLNYIAEAIEARILRDFRRTDSNWQTGAPEEVDELGCDTPDQREKIVAEAKRLAADLRTMYERVKNLDYLLSGDHGSESYIKTLK